MNILAKKYAASLFLFIGVSTMSWGSGGVLVDSATNNGGFETGKLAPWTTQKPRSTTDFKVEARAGGGNQPAAEGQRFLAIRALNKDGTRNSVSVTLAIKGIDLNKGSLFRVSWKARSRGAEEFNQTWAEIAFHAGDSAADQGNGKTGKREKIAADAWSPHTLEAVYDGKTRPDSIILTLNFLRETANKSPQDCEAYLDDVRLEQVPVSDNAAVPHPMVKIAASKSAASEDPQAPIPVRFRLEKPGCVTLVIEDEHGCRVRNLLQAVKFEAGEHTVWWDGTNEGQVVPLAGAQGAESIKRDIVAAGTYRVRGLVHDPLKLTYEFTLYPNCGNPPWVTNRESGAGGWLADHGAPTATAFIPGNRAPGGKDQVLLAAPVAEAGQALAWVDLNGNKLAGRWRLGGQWTGASHLARDLGDKPNPQIYLYAMEGWMQDNNPRQPEVRLMGLTKEGAVTVGMIHPEPNEEEKKMKQATFGRATGLAVHNGLLVYSTVRPGLLHFMETKDVSSTKRATPLADVAVEDPQGVIFDHQGRLLVLSENKVLRYMIGCFPNPLSKPEVVVASGLEDPHAITVDNEGNLYVADWGNSHQVKVFSSTGRPIRVIGHPGKPATGSYDPEHMNYPYGMTVTSDGKLWLAGYRWRTPKTVSVWTLGGKYVRSFYGPTEYGGGGAMDSKNPERFLYAPADGGVEFKVDWKAGTAVPKAIYWLRTETPDFSQRGEGPLFARHIGGHDYITNEFGGPTRPPSVLTIWKDRSPDAMRPAVFVGGVAGWDALDKLGMLDSFAKIKETDPRRWFSFTQRLLFCWTDENGDGQVQKEEVQFSPLKDDESIGNISTVALGKGYELLITHTKGVLSLKPRNVSEEGVPHYNLADCHPVAVGLNIPSTSGGGQALMADDGTVIVTGGPMYGVKDGKIIWTYHSQWPGLHAGHAAPKAPEFSGQLMATTRLLGPLVKCNEGEAGQMWAINSDKGLSYLLTSDGLYVDSLFQPPATGQPWDVPEAKRGMDVTGYNYFGETFWPTIVGFDDGRIFMVVGKQHSSLVQIHGLESTKRFVGGPITVGTTELDACRQYQTFMDQKQRAQTGAGKATIARSEKALEVDGDVNDWPALHWLVVGQGMAMGRFAGKQAVWTASALAVDSKTLYVAIRTRQQGGLLRNSGSDLQTLFHTGGGLDIQLATKAEIPNKKQAAEGDVRLVVTQVAGKTKAVLYRAVVPGTTEPVVYESPVGRTQIDRVDDVSDDIKLASKKLTLTAEEAGDMLEGEIEQIEVAIPLSLLGWNPDTLPVTRGDVGVLMGKGGNATVDRTYWHNKSAGLVNDIPSEARLEVGQWGVWEVDNGNTPGGAP